MAEETLTEQTAKHFHAEIFYWQRNWDKDLFQRSWVGSFREGCFNIKKESQMQLFLSSAYQFSVIGNIFEDFSK